MIAVMRWSLREFGEDAALRYDILLTQAFIDLCQDPERPGSQQRPDLGEGVFVYHLRFSRDRSKSVLGVVNHPRHFVIYRRQDRVIEILRVLHDVRDLQRHLPRRRRTGPAGTG
jgi:toxin ParE1/3/4